MIMYLMRISEKMVVMVVSSVRPNKDIVVGIRIGMKYVLRGDAKRVNVPLSIVKMENILYIKE